MRWRRWISAAVKWVSPLFASPQSSGQGVVTAIGVVVAVLAVAVLIARQQHRRALRQQKRRQQRMNAGASPLDHIQTSA